MWHIEVTAPRFLKIVSYAMSGTPHGRAMALYPFIFFQDESQKLSWVINHECIHFKQQIELLLIGTWILWIIETMYAHLWLRMSMNEAYRWRSSEQEAYRNQQNPDYIKTRRWFAQFYYMTHKRPFIISAPGEITYTDQKKPIV